MKYLLSSGIAVLVGIVALSAQQPSDQPRYTASGELIRPTDFR